MPLSSDVNDDKLERLARDKGVGTMIKTTEPEPQGEKGGSAVARPAPVILPEPPAKGATPRSRMKSSNIELPDYVWTELKIRAAQRQSSVRHIVMTALARDGITIAQADMVEDGRRDRGNPRSHR